MTCKNMSFGWNTRTHQQSSSLHLSAPSIHNTQPQMRLENMNKGNFRENWHLNAININKNSFGENWLSDPSTYPIIIVLSSAICFLAGMGVYSLTSYRDVRISPDRKHSEIQDRSNKHYRSFTESIGSHNKKYAPFFMEGIGVDHKEWLKRKVTESGAK